MTRVSFFIGYYLHGEPKNNSLQNSLDFYFILDHIIFNQPYTNLQIHTFSSLFLSISIHFLK